ncbi:SAM-dependent methyltransferase [Dechloromonas sp. XY25]|uniref:SAM-dependent methyltransferase n=1 Tax=Dechloromonas hankyongensis TaxID=2908002 RepID=A0ABS9K1P7_9RHOO|nr:methyltransferase [Dechloromonas hankyongensis]MCG2577095.1 SAM-dependent methyltransferase [Dechloromonas hankyongensis]
MNLSDRRQRLDGLLQFFHPLWHAQPFREARPAWCEQWPALAAELLALPDDAVALLNNDSAAALALLARHLPEVADVLALTEVPAYPVSAARDHGTRWAWEIPGRKQSQIEAFASASRPGGSSVLDWCGGKGHLGRRLALEWGLPVHTLEIDTALCDEGEKLAHKAAVDQRFWRRDALAVADWPRAGQHAIALHACGDLHRRLLTQGCAAGVSHFDVAPCCYYRGVDQTYVPLHDQGGLTLTRDDLRLAVTETVTASPRLARQRDREMAWKLGFDAFRREKSGAAYKTFKPVPAAWFRQGFGEFLQQMSVREGLPAEMAARSAERAEALGWQRQGEVMRLSIVRHAFRRALEIWLVLDLACYLESRGYTVDVGTFCPRQLTPRNLLISARRA